MTGRAAALAATIAVTLTASGCGALGGPGSGMAPQQVSGSNGRGCIVLLDDAVRAPLRAGIVRYTTDKHTRVVSAAGPATAVADGVEAGRISDVAVLPTGPDLDRIRDELITAPVPLGRHDGTLYWVATITGRGLPLTRYLTGPAGLAVLRGQGFTP